MQREPNLAPFSRDHLKTLLLAKRLAKVGAGQTKELKAALLSQWEAVERRHFGKEEELLAPLLACGDEPRRAYRRMVAEHRALEGALLALKAQDAPAPETLHALGQAFERHVRFEERVLFVLAEASLTKAQLAQIGAAL